MALNNYTTSSRFTDRTSPPPVNGEVVDLPEVSVTEKGETARERNDRRYREYQAQVNERNRLMSEEDKRVAMNRRDIENYDRNVEEYNMSNEGADFERDQRARKDFSMFAGGGKKVGSDALKIYNERQRKEGRPIATNLYRPADFKDDAEFLEALIPKGTRRGSIFLSDIRRPSKYIPKKYDEVDFPEIEFDLDRMKVTPAELNTRRQRAGNIEISGKTEYSDPRMPSRGKRDVFKGDRIKYASKGQRDNNIGSDRRRFRQEERLAKATYGRGLEQMTEGELDERKAILKERKRDQMRGGNFLKNLAVNQDARREIRDINRAKRYSDMVGGDDTFSISDRVKMGKIGKSAKQKGPKYFTPETMQGFRDSTDNPLNRNRRG